MNNSKSCQACFKETAEFPEDNPKLCGFCYTNYLDTNYIDDIKDIQWANEEFLGDAKWNL